MTVTRLFDSLAGDADGLAGACERVARVCLDLRKPRLRRLLRRAGARPGGPQQRRVGGSLASLVLPQLCAGAAVAAANTGEVARESDGSTPVLSGARCNHRLRLQCASVGRDARWARAKFRRRSVDAPRCTSGRGV